MKLKAIKKDEVVKNSISATVDVSPDASIRETLNGDIVAIDIDFP